MKIVALTGGIGSGKSVVSRMFAELGAEIIDADRLAREVVEPGTPAWKEIVDHFGKGVLNPDRHLNRERLASIVFSEPGARRTLEQMTHPRIRALFDERVRELQSKGCRIVIYDVPLFFETRLDQEIRPVIVVYTEESVRLARIKARDGFSDKDILSRMKSQMPLEEKKRLADYIVDNSDGLGETRNQVSRIWHELLEDP